MPLYSLLLVQLKQRDLILAPRVRVPLLCARRSTIRERLEALDIEAISNDGVVWLSINSTVIVLTTEDEYVAMTGYRQPSE